MLMLWNNGLTASSQTDMANSTVIYEFGLYIGSGVMPPIPAGKYLLCVTSNVGFMYMQAIEPEIVYLSDLAHYEDLHRLVQAEADQNLALKPLLWLVRAAQRRIHV